MFGLGRVDYTCVPMAGIGPTRNIGRRGYTAETQGVKTRLTPAATYSVSAYVRTCVHTVVHGEKK